MNQMQFLLFIEKSLRMYKKVTSVKGLRFIKNGECDKSLSHSLKHI